MKYNKCLQSRAFVFAIAAVAVTALFIPISGYAATVAEQELITQLQAQSQALQEKLNMLLHQQPVTPPKESSLLQDQSQAFQEKLNAALHQSQAVPTKEIHSVSQELVPASGDEPTTPPSFNFSRDLFFGMRADSDVTNLQEFLSEHSYYSGQSTGNFFLLTLKAVKHFQSANGISPTGYFGPKSRAIANDLISKELGSSGDGTIKSQGSLSIEPSSAHLEIGKSIQIKAMFAPARPACLDAKPACEIAEQAPYEVDVAFVSDHADIAVVDEIIDKSCDPPRACPVASMHHNAARGVSSGNAVITASYVSGGNTLTATMKVNVGAAASNTGSLSIEPSAIAIKTGETVALHTYYQLPAESCLTRIACPRTEVSATYASDNVAIAKIEKVSSECFNGNNQPCPTVTSVRGVAPGGAVITTSYRSGSGADPLTAQAKVTVTGTVNSKQPTISKVGAVISMGGSGEINSGGEAVVTGTNLGSCSSTQCTIAVYIGGNKTAVQSSSETTLIFVAPVLLSPGTYDLYVVSSITLEKSNVIQVKVLESIRNQ